MLEKSCINLNPLILVVEDNEDILFNLKLILESNNYQVITAKNGKEAIDVLSKLKENPEIILSDIMMPELDGYDFFKTISEDPRWGHIPFLFLTAKASPKDIRFGKMLGVDDYITKPFKEQDLLAVISGKITRKKRINSINKEIEEMLLSLNKEGIQSISEEDKGQVILISVFWDDHMGPTVRDCFPREGRFPFSINQVGQQLFQATVSIYGHELITKAEGMLLNIENISRNGYILFDSYPDPTARSKKREYMLGVIAPKISYFNSLKIKEILKEASKQIQARNQLDLAVFREKILNLLSTPF
ncbi:MAG: response regulator [Promethearchaeota archaeon]|nr:MAG: response regulator [Candidatus Lokiarchaeota archaeon]